MKEGIVYINSTVIFIGDESYGLIKGNTYQIHDYVYMNGEIYWVIICKLGTKGIYNPSNFQTRDDYRNKIIDKILI